MRFFLDENIPRNVQLFLIKSGYEVYDVRGTYDEGLSDKEIFLIAQKKHAIFVTTDKDFFHTIPYLFQEHNGIIVISLSQPMQTRYLQNYHGQ